MVVVLIVFRRAGIQCIPVDSCVTLDGLHCDESPWWFVCQSVTFAMLSTR